MNHLQIFFVVVSVLDICLVTGKEPVQSTPSGIRFLGVGYNLVNGNPEGGEGYNGGVDPGLLSTRQILALTYNEDRATNGFLVPDEVTFSPRQSCVKEASRSTFFGAKSYQNSLRLSVDASAKFLRFFEFSNSYGYSRVKTAAEMEHKVYYQETEVCNLGRARYREELASQFSITDGFASASCELTAVYNESQYMTFLNDWGTHVVVEADVGNKVIHRFETSWSSFIKYAMRNIRNSGSVSAGFWRISASLSVDFNRFNTEKSSGYSFGNSSYTFRIGDEDTQEPVHIRVTPIVDMFKPKYWMSLPAFVQKGICSGNFSVNKIRANIFRALNGYASWKRLYPAEDPNLSIPITWPKGTYGLPKSIYGCPGETWTAGFRKHRFSSSSYGSDPRHFDVDITSSYTTQRFCMKTLNEEVMDDWEFQEGHYCIYRKGDECPAGFDEGSIRWGDPSTYAVNDGVGGSVPDGLYTSRTTIYFCCRRDGFYENPILLPTDKPFILLANSFECQQVQGMNVTKEYFKFGTSYTNTVEGSVPIRGSSSFLTLYYCYYESIQDD